MHWLLIAVTMFGDGQPHRLQQLGTYETRAACEFGPEAMFPNLNASGAVLSPSERNPWVIRFSCVPTSEDGVREYLDKEEEGALALAGRGDFHDVWWRERQREIRQIGRK